MKNLKEENIEDQFENVRDTSGGRNIIELELDINGFERTLLQYDGRLIHLMLVMENPNFSEIENIIPNLDNPERLDDYVWNITHNKSKIFEIFRKLTEIINEEFKKEIFGCYIWRRDETTYTKNYKNYFEEYEYKITGPSQLGLWNVTLYCPNFDENKLEEHLELKILPERVGESHEFYCWKNHCKISLINDEFESLSKDRRYTFEFRNLYPLIYYKEIQRIVTTRYGEDIPQILNDEIELCETYINSIYDDIDDFNSFRDYYSERSKKIKSLTRFITQSKEAVTHYAYELKRKIMPHEMFQEYYPESYRYLEGIQRNMTMFTILELNDIEDLVFKLENNLEEARDREEFSRLTFVLEQNSEMISLSRWMVILTAIVVVSTAIVIFSNRGDRQWRRELMANIEIIQRSLRRILRHFYRR
jgi:hypothetical protein